MVEFSYWSNRLPTKGTAVNIILSDDHKTITVIGVNGDRVTRHATTVLNFCRTSRGGVTIWVDGEHKSQTTRVDSFGRLSTSNRP